MAVIPIRNVGSRGLVLDRNPWDLSPQELTAAQNVRYISGSPASTPGYIAMPIPIPVNENPLSAGAWVDAGSGAWFIECSSSQATATRLLRYNGNTLSTTILPDLPPKGFFSYIRLGSRLIVHSPYTRPYVLNSIAGNAAALPGWQSRPKPDGTAGDGAWRARHMATLGPFLVCAGLQEGGLDKYGTIAWSHELPPDDTSPVNFNVLDPTKLAGDNQLDPGDGRILALESIGPALLIYTERAVYRMDMVGGQLVFSFRRVFSDDGALSERAVCQINDNLHFVVGQYNIYTTDGNSKQFPADGRVKAWFYRDIADRKKVLVRHNPRFNEVWVLYRANNDIKTAAQELLPGEIGLQEIAEEIGFFDRALIYNYRYDAWSVRTLPNVSDVLVLPKLEPFVSWERANRTWNQAFEPWGDIETTYTPLLYAISPVTKKMYLMDRSLTDDGAAIECVLMQRFADLDEVIKSTSGTVKHVRTIYPQIQGDGTIEVTAIANVNPPGRYSESQRSRPFSYAISRRASVDVRQSGRYFTIGLTSRDINTSWQFSGYDLDIIEAGRR